MAANCVWKKNYASYDMLKANTGIKEANLDTNEDMLINFS